MDLPIGIAKYSRKPFEVEAVRITVENIKAVAEWCGGEIKTQDEGGGRFRMYISAPVPKGTEDRLSKGYVGNWILKAGNSFRVYTDHAFLGSFEFAGFLTDIAEHEENDDIEDSAEVEEDAELVGAENAD